MKNILLILLSFSVFTCFGQENQPINFNLGFEQQSDKSSLPDGWSIFGSGYHVNADSVTRHNGKIAIRIIPAGMPLENDFGACNLTFPAIYQGKNIELRGYMKMQDVTNGYAGIWMRIDDETHNLAFDNMKKKNLKGSSDWKAYSIKLPLSEKAVNISIGGLLTGTGTVWVDDFSILIDGIDISQARLKEIKIYKAEQDHEFDSGSHIRIGDLPPHKIEDLAILGQVWGFLKYYHPAIATGDYNWDYELFRIMPKVHAAQNAEERNKVLSEWVKKFGPVKKGKNKQPNTRDIKLYPDLAWISEASLGNTLSTMLTEIKEAKRTEEHYYIGLHKPVNNPHFKHEKGYEYMAFPDDGFRLLTLFRYWNMMQYYNPNRHLVHDNWLQVLREFIPKFTRNVNTQEYTLTTLELIGKVQDTHAGMYGNSALNSFFGVNYSALMVDFVETKAVVTGFYDTELGLKTGLQKGDVIESVNGKSVFEITMSRLAYTPASNVPTQMRNIAEDLLRSNDTLLDIQYRRDGLLNTTKLLTYPESTVNTYYRYQRPDTCFKLLTPDIAYLYMGSFSNEYLEKLMPDILKTKGLIIDMRCYPSDFKVFTLTNYLLPESTPFVRFSSGSMLQPGMFTLADYYPAGFKNKDYYKGLVIILVNEISVSSSEYHAMAFRAVPGAKVIGSTTAGADGNVSAIVLPGGINSWISGIGVYYPDGGETQQVGIVPDIEVKPTIEGIRQGRDEVLEKAIQVINRQ